MVVRLSDSQIAAFESAGVDKEYIGTMIANARSKGIGDDLIYSDLANRAAAFAKFSGTQIKELDRQIDDEKRDQMAEMAEALTKPKNEHPVGALTQALRAKAGDESFFGNNAPNVAGTTDAGYAAQKAAFEYGKGLNMFETFALGAGDMAMLSMEDFVYPEAEMIRAGAAESHPWAGALGAMFGGVGGLGTMAVRGATKAGAKMLGKEAKEEVGKAVKKSTGKKVAQFAGRTAVDAAIGTAQLAAKDAIQAASKNEEWRTFRIDSRRYSDDYIDGLGWSALFGGAGSYIARWRRGARNAANRFGGIEKIEYLQKQRQNNIDAGMNEVEANYRFQRDLIGTLSEEEQKAVSVALKNDPAFRQYFDDIATTMYNDIDRSATLITKKEIKKVTDDSMDALKRNQKLGSTDFDTSADGLLDALGTRSQKNMQIGKDLTTEGNIILTQDPATYDAFKAKTRQAVANMGDNKAYNALIDGAEAGDFEQVRAICQSNGIPLNSPQAKGMAQQYAKKLLDEGFDSVSQLNEVKQLIDNTANSGAIKAGKGTKIGGMREELNNVLETSFGDPNNPATLSGKYRGYHNVKHFEDIMKEAHDYGKNLDPIGQAESLASFLNSHGNAGADEAIAISTAVKMGYLDKLKTLAKEGDLTGWKQAVKGAESNPQMRTLLGGTEGIKEYMKAMEPEVRAAQSLKNILVSSRPGLKNDKLAQETLGAIVAMGTNSPLGATNKFVQIWNAIVPGGVTPAVGKNMQDIMNEPTWSNFNKFIASASQDPATRLQLSRVVDEWFRDISVGVNVGTSEMERVGAQNTQAMKGVR